MFIQKTSFFYIIAFIFINTSSIAGFEHPLNLADLDGENGFKLFDSSLDDRTNFFVSNIGDVNADSIDDIAVSSNRAGSWGRAYILFGIENGFPAPVDLDDLNGSNGFVVEGSFNTKNIGEVISHVGDINNDGIDDFAVSSPWFGDPVVGMVFVIYGSDSEFPALIEVDSLNGINGFKMQGIGAGDYTGFSISHAGDVNDDGVDDMVFSAPLTNFDSVTNAGKIYVVFGRTNFPATFFLNTLSSNSGYEIHGYQGSGELGTSVSKAGDFNGDGISDIVFGGSRMTSNGFSDSGMSFIVFGISSPINSVDLLNLNGSNGFSINGLRQNGRLGASVSSVGDINGDGFDDIAILETEGLDGNAYVIFGTNTPINSPFDLTTLNGLNGFKIFGAKIGGSRSSTKAISNAGDLNADGLDDLIIGAPTEAPNGLSISGESFVVFGSKEPFNSIFDLSTVDGKNGIVINGENARDHSGYSVSYAGDINNDGLDDVIIGTDYNDLPFTTSGGSNYVIYGDDTIFSNKFE